MLTTRGRIVTLGEVYGVVENCAVHPDGALIADLILADYQSFTEPSVCQSASLP